jgi:hypothetical protein
MNSRRLEGHFELLKGCTPSPEFEKPELGRERSGVSIDFEPCTMNIRSPCSKRV